MDLSERKIFHKLTSFFRCGPVGNKVTRKKLNRILREADKGNGIDTGVQHTLHKALPFYIMSDKTGRDHGPPERHHLRSTFRNLPAAGMHYFPPDPFLFSCHLRL